MFKQIIVVQIRLKFVWYQFSLICLMTPVYPGAPLSHRLDYKKNERTMSGCCCCLFGFNVAFNNLFSHITTVSGCDRELNSDFYSAA